MTSHQLRYTGEQATSFQPGGYVEPGGTLTVDEELLPGFLRRPDVEHSADCPCGNGGASEDSSADQDGETSGGGRSGRRGRSGSPTGKNAGGEQ